MLKDGLLRWELQTVSFMEIEWADGNIFRYKIVFEINNFKDC